MTLKEILIDLKNNNPYIYNCLIEDIEIYLKSLYEKDTRNWKHSKLNLNKEQILILRNSIINENNLYINEIKENILNYINKLKYKIILEKNYKYIEEIIYNGNTKNRLKSAGINTVGELIELTEEEIKSINKLGPTGLKTIKRELEERNIIFLNNSKLLEQMLKKENAGIKIKTPPTKEKLEEELKQAYKTYEEIKQQLIIQEIKIKVLEEQINNSKNINCCKKKQINI